MAKNNWHRLFLLLLCSADFMFWKLLAVIHTTSLYIYRNIRSSMHICSCNDLITFWTSFIILFTMQQLVFWNISAITHLMVIFVVGIVLVCRLKRNVYRMFGGISPDIDTPPCINHAHGCLHRLPSSCSSSCFCMWPRTKHKGNYTSIIPVAPRR